MLSSIAFTKVNVSNIGSINIISLEIFLKGQALVDKAGARTDFSHVPGNSKDTVVQEKGSNPQNYF